jgi:hypothetical protein
MTVADFRKLALSHPEATEGAHMDHPDFRVRGKIFATLGYPSAAHGVVKQTPKQQQALVDSDSETFVPAAGAWGRQGMTAIRLRTAPKAIVRKALYNAWCNTAPKQLVRTASFPPS